MERVTGIGGFLFGARDPAGLSRWYADHLGILPPAAIPAGSRELGQSKQGWTVNFRVHDLDAMIAQLRSVGIDVVLDDQTYPNGRFASLVDPEGNPIELWEPSAAALPLPPVESAEDDVDEASKESFPASDPPAWAGHAHPAQDERPE